MMFATLDDVEGQVEMLVFKADQAESAAVIEPDAVVLVRGRLDHKDRGETKLVVQEARALRARRRGDREGREPAPARPAGPLRADDRRRPSSDPGLLEELKAVFEHHKGEADVHLAIRPATASRRSCGSATTTGCGPRAGCAPSWTTCSGPAHWPLEPA